MGQPDACTGGVQTVENILEQVKGEGDSHWNQFLQALSQELLPRTPEQQQAFLEQLNSCNDARTAANPHLPKIHFGPGHAPVPTNST